MKPHLLFPAFAATLVMCGCGADIDQPQADSLSEKPADLMSSNDGADGGPAGVPGLQSNALSEATLAVQKDNAIATVEQEMAAVDARIAALGASVERAHQEGNTAAESAFSAMRDQRQELGALLERMRRADGNKWQELQQDFRAAYQTFLHTLDATEELLGG